MKKRSKIIVDTREQKPLFTKNVIRKMLDVGDYTTVKLHGKFHIERKSLADLYGTLTNGNKRFKYELFRAAYSQTTLEVFVEGTHDDFINKRFPKGEDRKFNKEGLVKLIKTFSKKYHLKFVWHKNRATCSKSVEMRFLEAEKKSK